MSMAEGTLCLAAALYLAGLIVQVVIIRKTEQIEGISIVAYWFMAVATIVVCIPVIRAKYHFLATICVGILFACLVMIRMVHRYRQEKLLVKIAELIAELQGQGSLGVDRLTLLRLFAERKEQVAPDQLDRALDCLQRHGMFEVVLGVESSEPRYSLNRDMIRAVQEARDSAR